MSTSNILTVKDHLIPYISNLDSSKQMYDALTNLFAVRNIGQVMSLKNELRDTKMTKDDTSLTLSEDFSVERSTTSY
jgi:hypothetical protein